LLLFIDSISMADLEAKTILNLIYSFNDKSFKANNVNRSL
jgi:hypothetical protein